MPEKRKRFHRTPQARKKYPADAMFEHASPGKKPPCPLLQAFERQNKVQTPLPGIHAL
jgi:hypothetical protein